MRQRTRLVAGAIAATVMCTMIGATVAAASPNPAPSTSVSATAPAHGEKPGGGIDKAELAKVAARLHVSVQRLITALVGLKKAVAGGESKENALAAFAQELGVSVDQARAALQELRGSDPVKKPGSGVPEQAVRLLAGELHISQDRARQVFGDLEKLRPASGDIVTNPGFIAIARGLGITPQQLVKALTDVKEKLAGSAPTK